MDKIIFFEPDETLANLYISKFQQQGVEVLHLGNPPKDFTQFIIKEKPSLILTSVIIPEIDWHRFIHSIKYKKNTKNIPIIVLTNVDNPDDKKTAFNIGVADYFVRSKYSPSEVVNKIVLFLNKRNKKIVFMNKFKALTTKKGLSIIVLIGIVLYLFYWFEWRPVNIIKSCYHKTTYDAGCGSQGWKNGSNCENYYNACLMQHGIK